MTNPLSFETISHIASFCDRETQISLKETCKDLHKSIPLTPHPFLTFSPTDQHKTLKEWKKNPVIIQFKSLNTELEILKNQSFKRGALKLMAGALQITLIATVIFGFTTMCLPVALYSLGLAFITAIFLAFFHGHISLPKSPIDLILFLIIWAIFFPLIGPLGGISYITRGADEIIKAVSVILFQLIKKKEIAIDEVLKKNTATLIEYYSTLSAYKAVLDNKKINPWISKQISAIKEDLSYLIKLDLSKDKA